MLRLGLSQVSDIESQRFGDSIQHENAGIASPPFDAAQISLVHLGQMGEFLLGDASCAPRFLDIEAHPNADVHSRMSGAPSEADHRL
jgi:hypothetical protein